MLDRYLREALAVEAADEDLRVGDGTVGPARVVPAVQREGSRLEVAFGHDAGLVDEALEVGAALDLCLVEVCGSAQGLEVDVDDRVALRQKARGLGRRLRAEVKGSGERSQDGERDDKRDPRASSHQLVTETAEGRFTESEIKLRTHLKAIHESRR